jgi:hypothetical protein
MKGRNRFNSDEIAFITRQLTALRRAERPAQKTIRARLRRAEFHISDWATDGQGFTASDFNAALRRGLIVRDESVGMLMPDAEPTDVGVPGGPIDTWVDAHLDEALAALRGERHDVRQLIETARCGRPPGAELDSPGLYALYGGGEAWQQLGLGQAPDDRPLYVGKAEDSMVARDLRTHFVTGKTGWSSPRRSLAALLVDQLRLEPIARRPENPEPGKWTHYALKSDGDARLTEWMLDHLHLAAWPAERSEGMLGAIERAVMQQCAPPLNLTGVSQPWTASVRAARAAMAAAAERSHSAGPGA